MNVQLRIARWQRRTSEETAQDLAREIELYEAPVIAEWEARVRANERRREQAKKIAAIARFVELPRTLKRQAI